MQYGFYFNMERCSECKTCAIACKDKNDLRVGINYRSVSVFEKGKIPNLAVDFISSSCNHCQKPVCVSKCPTGAMHKREEDGIVKINEEKCIGCQICVEACPYDAPQYIEEKNKTTKCDMCLDLVEKGEKPSCVTACLCRALDFGDIRELKKKYGNSDNIKFLPKPSLTKPSLIIKGKNKG